MTKGRGERALPPGRARKVASKHLGVALQAAHRRLLEAEGQENIQFAAIELGNLFNMNIEFVCWVLKEYGGVQQMPPERTYAAPRVPVASKPVMTIVPPEQVNEENKLPVLDAMLTGKKAPEDVIPKGCTCGDPVEVITSGHMASCPEYRMPEPSPLLGFNRG